MDFIKIIDDKEFNIEPKELNDPKMRYAARGLVFNSDNKIAILNKKNKNEYKLVGGGLEGEEDPKLAFKREVLEEAGCEVEIDDFIGNTKEERSQYNFVQISYIYTSHVVNDTHNLHLTEKEIAEGGRLLWMDIDEAIEKIRDCIDKLIPSDYEDVYTTKFVVRRDYYILKYYKEKYLKEI